MRQTDLASFMDAPVAVAGCAGAPAVIRVGSLAPVVAILAHPELAQLVQRAPQVGAIGSACAFARLAPRARRTVIAIGFERLEAAGCKAIEWGGWHVDGEEVHHRLLVERAAHRAPASDS